MRPRTRPRIRSRPPWAAYSLCVDGPVVRCDQIETALGDVEAAGENHQTDQGRHAAARQHAVVDLQHEDRAGEVQQIDHATHDADADKGAAAGAQRFTELGTPDGSGCH